MTVTPMSPGHDSSLARKGLDAGVRSEGHDYGTPGQIGHGLRLTEHREPWAELDPATIDIGNNASHDRDAEPPTSGWLPVEPTPSSVDAEIVALLGVGSLCSPAGGRSPKRIRVGGGGWLLDGKGCTRYTLAGMFVGHQRHVRER